MPKLPSCTDHREFADHARAKQMQIYDLFEEILDAARDSSGDWVVQRGPDGRICRELASCRRQAVANREAGALKPTHLCPI